jgi:hypothetical protein
MLRCWCYPANKGSTTKSRRLILGADHYVSEPFDIEECSRDCGAWALLTLTGQPDRERER